MLSAPVLVRAPAAVKLPVVSLKRTLCAETCTGEARFVTVIVAGSRFANVPLTVMLGIPVLVPAVGELMLIAGAFLR